MVVKVFCGYDNTEHLGEWRQFNEVVELIRSEFEDESELIYIFGNLLIGRYELDMIIVTQSGIAIVDLKGYQGRIVGGQNGIWYVYNNRRRVRLSGSRSNLFIQLRNHRYALLDKLRAFWSEHLQRISEIEFRKIKCWGYFINGSTYDINQIDRENHVWFDIITADTLFESLRFLNNNFRLVKDDMDLLVDFLRLKECEGIDSENNYAKDEINDIMAKIDDNKVSKRGDNSKRMVINRRRPPKRHLGIVELWIAMIDRASELSEKSKLSVNDLREKIRNSQLYLGEEERFSKSVNRLGQYLSESIKKGYKLFKSSNDLLWSLSDQIILIMQTSKFWEEWNNDSENAVMSMWQLLMDGEWKGYYETSDKLWIDIPVTLRPFLYQMKHSEDPPQWLRVDGIYTQDVEAGYVPINALRKIKKEVEEIWEIGKIPLLIANPAHGKTTSLSILLHKWKGENAICFKIESTSISKIIEELMDYINKSSKFITFIVSIENIHLRKEILEIFQVNKHKNVKLILTSRVHEARIKAYDVHDEIVLYNLPEEYYYDLIHSFLAENEIEGHDEIIFSLLENGSTNNVLFTLTTLLELNRAHGSFNWNDFIFNLEETLITSSNLDKYLWRWIFYVLSRFKELEIQIPEKFILKISKKYNPELTPSQIGKLISELEENGLVIFNDINGFDLTFHPTVAEKIREKYAESIKILFEEFEVIDLQIFQIWLDLVSLNSVSDFFQDLDLLVSKIGLDLFHQIEPTDSYVSNVMNLVSSSKKRTNFHNKTRLMGYYKDHPINPFDFNQLINENDYFQYLLNFENRLPSSEIIKGTSIDMIHEYYQTTMDYSKISLQKLFKKFEWVEDLGGVYDPGGGGFEPGYAWGGESYHGTGLLNFLSNTHPHFYQFLNSYLKQLYDNSDTATFMDFIFRLKINILVKLQFNYLPQDWLIFYEIPFCENSISHIIDEDFLISSYEFLDYWKGPDFLTLRTVLLHDLIAALENNTDIVYHNAKSNYFVRKNYKISDRIDQVISLTDLEFEIEREFRNKKIPIVDLFKKTEEWIIQRLLFLKKFLPLQYQRVINSKTAASKIPQFMHSYKLKKILKDMALLDKDDDFYRIHYTVDDFMDIDEENMITEFQNEPFKHWYDLDKFEKTLNNDITRSSGNKQELRSKLDRLFKGLIQVRDQFDEGDLKNMITKAIRVNDTVDRSKLENKIHTFFGKYNFTYGEFLKLGNEYYSKFGTRNGLFFWKNGITTLDNLEKKLFFDKIWQEFTNLKLILDILDTNISDYFEEWLISNLSNNDLLNQVFEYNRFLTKSISQDLLKLILDKLANTNDFVKAEDILDFLKLVIDRDQENKLSSEFVFTLRRFNSIFFFKVFTNLDLNLKFELLEFLRYSWPESGTFEKTCNLIGSNDLADLLCRIYGISLEEKYYGFYSKEKTKILFELNIGINLLSELINKSSISKGNVGSILILYQYLHEFQLQDLLNEFPNLISDCFERNQLKLAKIFTPDIFKKSRNLDILVEFIRDYQELRRVIINNFEEYLIDWLSDKDWDDLQIHQIIYIITQIWKWENFQNSINEWEKISKEIICDRFLQYIIDNQSEFVFITPNKSLDEETEYTELNLKDFIDQTFSPEYQLNLLHKLSRLLKFNQIEMNFIDFLTYLKLYNLHNIDLIDKFDEKYFNSLFYSYMNYNYEDDFDREKLKATLSLCVQPVFTFIVDVVKQFAETFNKFDFNKRVEVIDDELINILRMSGKSPKIIFMYLDFDKFAIIEKIRFITQLTDSNNLCYPISIIRQEDLNNFDSELLKYLGLLLLHINKCGLKNEIHYFKEMMIKNLDKIELADEYDIYFGLLLSSHLNIDLLDKFSSYSSQLYNLLRDQELWNFTYYSEDEIIYREYRDLLNVLSDHEVIWNYMVNQKEEELNKFLLELNFGQITTLLQLDSIFNLIITNSKLLKKVLTHFSFEKYQEYRILSKIKGRDLISYYQPRFIEVTHNILMLDISEYLVKSQEEENFDLIRYLLKANFSDEVSAGLKLLSQGKLPNSLQNYLINYDTGLFSSIVYRGRDVAGIIEDLDFIKLKLPILDEHIIRMTEAGSLKSHLRNSNTSRDFYQVIWYFCKRNEWHDEALKLAQILVDDNSFWYGYELPVILKFANDTLPEKIAKKVKERNDNCKANHKNPCELEFCEIISDWIEENY